MSRKTLNLWPMDVHEQVDVRRQMVVEVFFSGLLVLLLVTATCVWLSWRTAQVKAVNVQLSQAQHALQGQDTAGGETDVADAELARLQNGWRAQRSGQLNWLVALAEVSSQNVKFTSVKQSNTHWAIEGQANDPESIKNAMNLFAQKMDRYRVVKLTLLQSKSPRSLDGKVTDKGLWIFGAEFEAHATAESAVGKSSTAEDHADIKTTPKEGV